jgi:CO/xanthine dehydrogenase Mo-binding subunit
MTEGFQTVGKSMIRKDAWEKAAGKALYTADIQGDEIRIGRILRSPHHHARILAIDPSSASGIEGVLAVITAEDIPGEKTFGALVPDQPSLASDVVRHLGEPVALVIARDGKAADQGLAAIKVSYEPLQPVFDPETALEPDAPRLHADGNLVSELDLGNGDPRAGFEDADVVVEDCFEVPRIHPGYMEPETSMASWEEDQSVTVWVSSQHPFTDQQVIAAALDMPLEKVRVKSAVVGGAFGGKEDSSLAILAALGAQAIQGAVRLVNTRKESFLAHPKRHPARIYFKLGAKSDGTFTALEAKAYLDTGAYASYCPAVAMILVETLAGAYRIPNVQINRRVVYTNSPLSGAMRGFGSPQAHFALESMVDRVAEKLGLDPILVRERNILHKGEKMFTGVQLNESANALPVILEKSSEVVKRYQKIPAAAGKRSGVGFALAAQSMGLGAQVPDDSTHRLEWTPEGKVLIHLGSPELGQGLATAVEQITAEALGVPFEQVEALPLDTLERPNGNVTCASRMTYMVGNAVINASEKLVNSLLSKAAEMLDVSPEELQYKSGSVIKKDGAEMPAEEFLARLAEESLHLTAESTFSFPYPEETTPQDLPIGMPHVLYCFGAQIARVEVDPMLGTVEVTHFAAVHDVGKVISLPGVEGQIEGGVATGLGYALYETMLRKDDQWVDSFTEYLLPTANDLPVHYENIILEVPEGSGPYGAKGIGEIPLVPTAPAVANAVYQAVGIRVNKLPITPERVLGMSQ